MGKAFFAVPVAEGTFKSPEFGEFTATVTHTWTSARGFLMVRREALINGVPYVATSRDISDSLTFRAKA